MQYYLLRLLQLLDRRLPTVNYCSSADGFVRNGFSIILFPCTH
ncbi:hypothetical protein ES332_D05G297600v1 [Gossypium tomentosum]|uniref:Uncharacterized protein n=1 Tax=Gossypium tomentosum TaxID=34277 RepID=A0A5D2L0Z8_GOSTO|nr:hypothetical protein ES332_D05G297600v1 [Gossypium tomentosum]